jgi:D-alanyl-D-alanine carboxypeptidase
MKRKRKRPVALAALALALTSAIVLLSCVPSIQQADKKEQLQRLVFELVEQDKYVKNCVLSVMKGDSSFSWSGAAGIAKQDGQVPMTKDVPIYIASITKLYTATAIMRMYEEGALSLDDPIKKYLPDSLIHGIHVYKGKDFTDQITIRHLLSHTSGIADYYSEKGKDGRSLFDLFLESPDRSWTVEDTIERARIDLEPLFPPGTKASYSDTNYQLLGKIVETVACKSLAGIYEDLFFSPLGLKHTWLVGLPEKRTASTADVFYKDRNITRIRSNGSYWADGGIVSTAEEMIVFLKALNEGQIIGKDTLRLMHNWHKLEFPLQYGYGTMYFKLPAIMAKMSNMRPLWGHSGSTGSFLYFSDELNLYMAGTIDQVESHIKPFRLMSRAMKIVE